MFSLIVLCTALKSPFKVEAIIQSLQMSELRLSEVKYSDHSDLGVQGQT